MLPLNKRFRNLFERKIKEAREIAEEASQSSLNQLGIGVANPYSHLTNAERELRRRLRAHGRQLGDKRNNQNQTQEIEGLLEEVAYQHWHRMLFARFLAENHLLMYPDPEEPVPITLEECEDLAAEEGTKNGWEVAARYAERMLPQIFRSDSPIFEVEFPPEYQQRLERLLIELPSDIFTASDSLGWVYQYWQAKKKEEVNSSERKIGARELPAVTQLFTEPYMVNFLLDNTIGAWWANKQLGNTNHSKIDNEEELKSFLTLPGLSLEYTRFVKQESGSWKTGSGTFDSWPNELRNFKLLDPCCGSGHFLAGALLTLVPIRMELEGLSTVDAINAVLKENLFGLDIDQRVVEIAVFALALLAWRYPGAGGYRKLPELNIACIGLAISNTKEEWIKLANENEKVKNSLNLLYEEFSEAPTLGSLINPRGKLSDGDLLLASGDEVKPFLETIIDETSIEYNEMGVKAQGIVKAAGIIIEQYSLVITNVPYLKGGDHGLELKRFCELHYPNSKYDLATVFIDRSKGFLHKGGTLAVVTQQYWLFLKYYENLRQNFIRRFDLGLIARLGPGAFETIKGEIVNVCLQITHNKSPDENHEHSGLELDKIIGVDNKITSLKNDQLIIKLQHNQLKNPNKRISFELSIDNNSSFLSKYADFGKGSVTGDSPHYIRKFWEVNIVSPSVTKWLNSPNSEDIWSGREHVILWDNKMFNPQEEIGFRYHGQRVFNKRGIAIGKAGKFRFTPYTGELFDDNIMVICPYEDYHIDGIWNYCNSNEFEQNLRKLDKKMSVTAGTFTKVQLNPKWLLEHSSMDINYPYSDDPTQWVFHGHPVNTQHSLQVAVARLVGYKWPTQADSNMEISYSSKKIVDKCSDLDKYVNNDDGIVCIPSVLGEAPAADLLLNILARAYGEEWSNNMLSQLLTKVDHSGKTLETWLRNKFFAQHCQLFHQRPLIWHIWDGLPDGFSAMINYQKLDRKLLERLIYTYLGDWIKKQKNDLETDLDGVEEKLVAAENLKNRLELILEGNAPYDIFVRWKPIEEQPIGWDPDLYDGVRLNIRPFMSVPDIAKKGAGILRDKPNIKWNKDRGKDVETAPWYSTFGGNRINDYHLSLVDKMEARRKRKEDLS
jgi:hypothetical protein